MSVPIQQHSNKSAQLVQQIRERFLEDYQNNKGMNFFQINETITIFI
jgi:hypothetical protein